MTTDAFRPDCYLTPAGTEAPRYIHGKRRTGQPGRAKLTRYDVADMRHWARTEGFGLPFRVQSRILAEQWTMVSPRTIDDVLANLSFFDATYDRTAPLMQETAMAVPLVSAPSWLMAWLVFLSALCVAPAPVARLPGEDSCSAGCELVVGDR